VWCCRCGYYASKAARKLVVPCAPAATGAGRDYLRRLLQDLPPKKGMDWPLTELQAAAEAEVRAQAC